MEARFARASRALREEVRLALIIAEAAARASAETPAAMPIKPANSTKQEKKMADVRSAERPPPLNQRPGDDYVGKSLMWRLLSLRAETPSPWIAAALAVS